MALEERRVMDAAPGPRPRRLPSLRQFPFVCWAIIIVSAGVHVLAPAELRAEMALTPAHVSSRWWQIVSATIVHGNELHLLMNMSVVWTVGFQLERAIGSLRLLLISAITAVGTSLVVIVFADPNSSMVGASGMIIGWIATMLFIATKEGRRQIILWLVQIAIITLLPVVSKAGHVGGFLFGLPCGLLLRNRARYFNVGAPILLALTVAATVAAAMSVGARFG